MTAYIVKVNYGDNRITEYTVEATNPRAAGNKIRKIMAKGGHATNVKIKRMTVTEKALVK